LASVVMLSVMTCGEFGFAAAGEVAADDVAMGAEEEEDKTQMVAQTLPVTAMRATAAMVTAVILAEEIMVRVPLTMPAVVEARAEPAGAVAAVVAVAISPGGGGMRINVARPVARDAVVMGLPF
jgi:hypothetical protein